MNLSTLQSQREHYAAIKARMSAPKALIAIKPKMRPFGITSSAFRALNDPTFDYGYQFNDHVYAYLVYQEKKARKYPSVHEIVREVSRAFKVTEVDILSQRRHARIIIPRQLAMWLARHHTLKSLPEIGRLMGGRDHTTVLHAVKKMDRLVPLTLDVAAIAAAIRLALGVEVPEVSQ